MASTAATEQKQGFCSALASTLQPVSFTMPTPPSTNMLFRNVKGKGRVKTRHYEDFTHIGITAIRMQNVKPVPGNVLCVIGVERTSLRADIDNRLKAMLDTIVKASVIEDDRCVTGIAISWLPPANGLSHISIFPVRKVSLTFRPSQNGASGGWYSDAPFNGE